MNLVASFGTSLLVLAVLSACAQEQEHIVRLDVSSRNSYLVDGEQVELLALEIALKRAKEPGHILQVRIVPERGASYEAVRAAVEAAGKAGAYLGMVGSEASPPAIHSSGTQR